MVTFTLNLVFTFATPSLSPLAPSAPHSLSSCSLGPSLSLLLLPWPLTLSPLAPSVPHSLSSCSLGPSLSLLLLPRSLTLSPLALSLRIRVILQHQPELRQRKRELCERYTRVHVLLSLEPTFCTVDCAMRREVFLYFPQRQQREDRHCEKMESAIGSCECTATCAVDGI